MRGSIYIPERIYNILKSIYSEGMTVVCAPLGSGKSTVLREFVHRSRPDSYSCRFVTGCRTSDECFVRITEILFGHGEHIPITDEDGAALYFSFRNLRLKKPLLLVVDCDSAAEMLLGNLYCIKLLRMCENLHITITANDYSHFQRKLVTQLSIKEINSGDLALTESEAKRYFELCGIACDDFGHIYSKTKGNIFKLRLCALSLKNGQKISSCDEVRLLHSAVISRLSRRQYLALICAAAEYELSDYLCTYLGGRPAMTEYFGSDAFSMDNLVAGLEEINAIVPLVEFDRRRNYFRVHELMRRAVYRSFVLISPNVQREILIFSAKEHLANRRSFEAFCNFVAAKDYSSAAEVKHGGEISLNSFLSTKQVMFKFALECPLDYKPILPWLLHILVLLMFTDYKERVKFRFDEITRYVSISPDYSDSERRSMLAYAYAMGTYQDFYAIERMGLHVKRAYDYYSGGKVNAPPFYLWALYVPSMFALIHRYSMPISAQAEQFVRYNRMYIEISGHGRYFDRVYLAELKYAVGDFTEAMACCRSIIEEATDNADIAPRMIAHTVASSCALMTGSYDELRENVNAIAEIMRRNRSSDVYRLGALCLALTGCHKEIGADIWRITSVPDETICEDRYVAPFCYFIRSVSNLAAKDYARIIAKKDDYLSAIELVHCDTLAAKLRLCAASAYYSMSDYENALQLLRQVLDVLKSSEVIMPAVEACIQDPQLFAYANEQLPQQYSDYISEVIRMAKPLRRNVENLRTQELTEIWSSVREREKNEALMESVSRAAATAKQSLGLTESAAKYALLAAEGLSNEEISALCGATVNSIKSSLKRTYARLGVKSRAQLKYCAELNRCRNC